MELEFSNLVIVGAIIVGVLLAVFKFSAKQDDVKSAARGEISNQSHVIEKGDKKPKRKDKKPKKAAKKQDLNNTIKNDIAAYEENDYDDDERDDGKNSPPPLEPVSPKIVDHKKVTNHIQTSSSAISSNAAVKTVPAVAKEPETIIGGEDAAKKKKAKETPEQKAARLQRQKLAKVTTNDSSTSQAQAIASSNSSSSTIPMTSSLAATANLHYDQQAATNHPQVDGWAKVEDKRKTKAAAPVAPVIVAEKKEDSSSSDSSAPVVEIKKSSVNVEHKKVGVVIGPKGETLKKLQELLKVEIITPKDKSEGGNAQATIFVNGSPENVPIAIKAIQDLCNKGYSPLLEGNDFMEGHISVPFIYISEIIGKGGNVRKNLQDHTGVRIVVPPNVERKPNVLVKILLAGAPAKVSEVKKLIKELMQYYHTSITHPGLIHNEMAVPSPLYNIIIGKGGSEIKHIQNNFKVSVYIPNAESVNQNVLVVGESKGVTQASNYIQKIIDQATVDKEAATIAADSWAEHEGEKEEEGEEEWMKAYIKKSNSGTNNSADGGFDNDPNGTSSNMSNEDENPSLSMAYKGVDSSNVSRSFTPSTVGQSWAATVLQSADGW